MALKYYLCTGTCVTGIRRYVIYAAEKTELNKAVNKHTCITLI